jgi:hypothetical protein
MQTLAEFKGSPNCLCSDKTHADPSPELLQSSKLAKCVGSSTHPEQVCSNVQCTVPCPTCKDSHSRALHAFDACVKSPAQTHQQQTRMREQWWHSVQILAS